MLWRLHAQAVAGPVSQLRGFPRLLQQTSEAAPDPAEPGFPELADQRRLALCEQLGAAIDRGRRCFQALRGRRGDALRVELIQCWPHGRPLDAESRPPAGERQDRQVPRRAGGAGGAACLRGAAPPSRRSAEMGRALLTPPGKERSTAGPGSRKTVYGRSDLISKLSWLEFHARSSVQSASTS